MEEILCDSCQKAMTIENFPGGGRLICACGQEWEFGPYGILYKLATIFPSKMTHEGQLWLDALDHKARMNRIKLAGLKLFNFRVDEQGYSDWFKWYETERNRVVTNMQKPWWKKIWS